MKRICKQFLAVLFCAVLLFSFVPLDTAAVFTGNDRIVLVLDPGHGGSSIGTAAGDVAEKTVTLQLAFLLRDRLEQNGNFQIYLTRTSDIDVALSERAIYANKVGADLLISLHFDGSTSASPRGLTAYTSVFEQWALISLGNSICNSISAVTGIPSNGVIQKYDTEGFYWNAEFQWDCEDPSLGVIPDYYGIPAWCVKFGIPSMIMEHGYFTNAADRAILFADGMLEKIADAEAQAIINYFTNHNHTYGARTQDFPSNCMFAGKTSVHCTICGHRKDIESLAAAPDRHYWTVESSSPASCGVNGYTNYVCRITSNLNKKGYPCTQHTYTEVIPAPTDHHYTLRESVDAGHTTDGYQLYACEYCGDRFREVLPAEGHSWEYVAYVEPTCTEHGGDLYRCTVCGGEYYEGGGALGHQWEQQEYIAPSCTQEGYENKLCNRCSEVQESYFDALGHDFGGKESREEATCAQAGYLRGLCLRCGDAIDEELPRISHQTEITEIIAPGCVQEGAILSLCTVCGEAFTEVIPACGHVWAVGTAALPDCTEKTKRELICAMCGEQTSEILKASGHLWSAGETVKKAGIFLPGKLQYVCENGCGEIREQSVLPWIANGGLWLPVAAAVLAWCAAVFLLLRWKKQNDDALATTAEEVAEAIAKTERPEPTEEKEIEKNIK